MAILASAQEYSNVIKFLPTNLYFNQATFEWEQNKGQNSLILDVGIPINRSVYDRFGLDHNGVSFDKLGTNAVRVAFRHYTSQIHKYGLYGEVSIKEETMGGTFITKNPSVGKIDGYLYSTNLGIQLGYQWHIQKHWVIDLYFFGLEGGRVNGRAQSIAPTSADAIYIYNDIQRLVNKLPRYVQRNYHEYIYKNNVSAELHSTLYPAPRIGASVGFVIF